MFVDALLYELVDLYYEARFGETDPDGRPSQLVLADWLTEHERPHLAEVFRDPLADHEGWTIDILTLGLDDAELRASRPGSQPRS